MTQTPGPSPEISVVASALNEAGNIRVLYDRITSALDGAGVSFELILVDNAGTDGTWELMRSLRDRDKRVKCLRLSKTFGHTEALLAGIDHSSGAAVVTMDSDLQHPPELLPRLIAKWREGFSVVSTVKKRDYRIPFLRYHFTVFFYALINRISGLKLSFGQSDFRLLDRRVVEVLKGMKERPKFLRGIVDWIGFNRTSIEYSVQERLSGKSTYNLWRLLEYGFNGIFSFSMIPLRILLITGLLAASLSLLFMFYNIVVWLIAKFWIPVFFLPTGFTTLAVVILFIGSVQLIGIGLLGEYLGRVYTQVKNRPEYIIAEKIL